MSAANLPTRLFSQRLAILFCALALICSPLAFPVRADDKTPDAAPPKGQRVMICGHSFHVFVGGLIAKVAESAGIKDHVNLGTQSIGGSTVTQHWKLEGPTAIVKPALTAGAVDVLTLAPHMRLVPDKAIEDFAELGFQHNPNLRILVQESWYIYDGTKPPIKVNTDRDTKTIEELRPPLAEFKDGLEKQAKEINAKLGKQIVFVVPVGDAVLALREKVIKGEVPGITRQSELFSDEIGHVKAPVQQLEAYCYFAAIYHQSPVGLSAFDKPGDDDGKKLNHLLEEIAWEAVTSDPMSGVSATKAEK